MNDDSRLDYSDAYPEDQKTIIEVRLNIREMPLHNGPERHFDWLEAKLKAAGIPVDGNNLLHGTLTKFDDPTDFGATIYRWEPCHD